MKVKATQMGYYEHVRRKPDSVFEMDDKLIKKDNEGKVVSPKWVQPVDPPKAEHQNKAVEKENASEAWPHAKGAAVKGKSTGSAEVI